MKTETDRSVMPSVERHTNDHGVALVTLTEDQYIRLLQKADEWEPPALQADENGNYPLEVLRYDLARSIIHERRVLGWTHAELARRAGVRLESVYRAEDGRMSAGERVIGKIDRALKIGKAEAKKAVGTPVRCEHES